jgi:preprotein translocase subunit SecE
MARNPGASPSASKTRAAKAPAKSGVVIPAAPVAKTAKPDAPRKPSSPAQFAREVRAEARKITWTTRNETWITSVMVFIMVVVSAIFFLLVDQGLGATMQMLLNFAAKGS